MKNFNIIISIIVLLWCGVIYNRISDYYEFDEILQIRVNNTTLLVSEQINLSISHIESMLDVSILDEWILYV